MDPVRQYLQELHEIRSTGAAVPETSYYGALERLLNDVGSNLTPRVRCVLQLANRGAGNPDGGLYTSDQFQKTADGEPVPGQLPARGAVEVKPTSDDAWITARSTQVTKYWKRYRLVLITNYRDFLVMGEDDKGKPSKIESFRLAEDERSFWNLANQSARVRNGLSQRFVEFLMRVLQHGISLSKPEDVAWFLASYAKDARSRIEETDISTLTEFRTALQEVLGMKFEGAEDEDLFRSSFIQTLFYGVFSAWVLWAHERDHTDTAETFDWKRAGWSLHVPMIRALYESVSGPLSLRPLNLVQPLQATANLLNRVDRKAFLAVFEQGEAVQYFYEPFLQHFDPKLRKRYGVWYTPPEIVKYMVARVDTVLREELGIEDGLADKRVHVLDPCCGTGAYLVEVLKSISETLHAKGTDALAAEDVKKAARERVFGFEIMPAPFVVAHLQVGLLLQRLGSPLSHDDEERAAVYLTNALTDWEPPKDPKDRVITGRMHELDEERAAAGRIKRETPILVVLGNPPYNAFAGTATTDEERTLIEPYKAGLNKPVKDGGWGIRKFNLDELYVRFFRLAERRIVDLTKRGVVCFISSSSYLNRDSFVVMRDRYTASFDSIWIDNMNGDSRETGKLTPDGKPDPSVFSTDSHPIGIRVGTAIGLLVRSTQRTSDASVRYRDFWGDNKRRDLLISLQADSINDSYCTATPSADNYYSLQPERVGKDYKTWPSVTELASDLPPKNWSSL